MPRSLAKGPHFKGCHESDCQVRTDRTDPLDPYPYFIFLHFAVRSNIMDDVHTHQVTDK